VTLQKTEMRMVGCVALKQKMSSSKELRQTRIWWHNLRSKAKDFVLVWACVAKKRQRLGEEMYGVWSAGCQNRGRPKRTWREIVQKDCQARKLNREDATDRSRLRKQINGDW